VELASDVDIDAAPPVAVVFVCPPAMLVLVAAPPAPSVEPALWPLLGPEFAPLEVAASSVEAVAAFALAIAAGSGACESLQPSNSDKLANSRLPENRRVSVLMCSSKGLAPLCWRLYQPATSHGRARPLRCGLSSATAPQACKITRKTGTRPPATRKLCK
jgi:hypothetical protein